MNVKADAQSLTLPSQRVYIANTRFDEATVITIQPAGKVFHPMPIDLETAASPSKSAPLLGFWYPAMLASNIRPGTVKAQLLLGMPLAICRDSQKRTFAFRDICPHRGMPLSFGRFEGDRLECSYHGWQFDMSGRCRHIPALVDGATLQTEKIGVTTYPCEERDGYVWVYLPDGHEQNPVLPEVPRLPLLSDCYRMVHVSTILRCASDDGIVGLVDPAHGAFVHQSLWWRTPKSIHEKAKTFEPIPGGFRMTAHTPSRNSGPLKLLKAYGNGLTTTIDFVLPNLRPELIQFGPYWISMRTTVTPITEHECRMDFCAAWNCFRWAPFSKTLFRFFARLFLNQDMRAFERQAVGLRYKPPLMLLDDADTPAKWYYKLKAAHLAASQSGRPMEHPLKEPITLRWRS